MDFEPQKFFVGLIDFFSVLLPGALVAYLLKLEAPGLLLVDKLAAVGGAEGAATFIVASYLLGHFLFLAGSRLDDIYDAAQKQVRAIGGSAPSSDFDKPAWHLRVLTHVFARDSRPALENAERIRDTYLEPIAATKVINAFQWSKLHLGALNPEALATVQRFEADSKFFRSLAVVLIMLIAVALVGGPLMVAWRRADVAWRLFGYGGSSVVLLLLALWRYAEQRSKMTTQAYWAVIALEGRLKRRVTAEQAKESNTK